MAKKRRSAQRPRSSGTGASAARAGRIGGVIAGIAAALIAFRFSNGGLPEISWRHAVFILAAIFVIYKVSEAIRNALPTPDAHAQTKKKNQ